ncbi:MAG: YceI family protein [Saprospiraceae bacterium]|nr:YceI family protein [Saprospiraceae bacterium]
MKKQLFFLPFVAAVGLNFTGVSEKMSVNTTQSTISWKAYKVTGSHEGILKLKEGALNVQDGQLIGGNFIMDMTSISVTDLEGDMKGKLEGHLKSDDFFGVTTYPTAKLEVTNVTSRGTEGAYKVTANLTIKNITKEIKFNADILQENGQTIGTADIVVDRSDFNVRYGSGSFFENLGDKTIYDEFELSVRLVVE